MFHLRPPLIINHFNNCEICCKESCINNKKNVEFYIFLGAFKMVRIQLCRHIVIFLTLSHYFIIKNQITYFNFMYL